MSTTPTDPDTPASTSIPSAITDAATSIRTGNGVVTLINVFTVAPEHQQELIEVLDRATVQVMRHLPGFVSANIHRGLGGTRVANYAQWTSRAAYEAMLGNPAAAEHMARPPSWRPSSQPCMRSPRSMQRRLPRVALCRTRVTHIQRATQLHLHPDCRAHLPTRQLRTAQSRYPACRRTRRPNPVVSGLTGSHNVRSSTPNSTSG